MLANCERCGALFTKSHRGICPSCVQVEAALVNKVNAYLHEHRSASMLDVVRDTGVDFRIVSDMVKNGRLNFR